MSSTRQFCTFYVAGQLFGLPVQQVQEIIRDQATTRIPLAPPMVAGLINLRGQIVPVVDLRRCLALSALPVESQLTHLMLTTASGVVSLRVDEIGDVLDVSEEVYESTPDNLRGAAARLVSGVYKLERGLLLVLSIEMTIGLATATRSPEYPALTGVA